MEGEKRPERGVEFPPSSGAEVKERVELYIYSPFTLLLHFYGNTFLATQFVKQHHLVPRLKKE